MQQFTTIERLTKMNYVLQNQMGLGPNGNGADFYSVFDNNGRFLGTMEADYGNIWDGALRDGNYVNCRWV